MSKFGLVWKLIYKNKSKNQSQLAEAQRLWLFSAKKLT